MKSAEDMISYQHVSFHVYIGDGLSYRSSHGTHLFYHGTSRRVGLEVEVGVEVELEVGVGVGVRVRVGVGVGVRVGVQVGVGV